MCRQLVQIVFEECSRIAWDPFLHEKKNEIENQMQTTPNNESFAMSLSSAFQEFVLEKNKIWCKRLFETDVQFHSYDQHLCNVLGSNAKWRSHNSRGCDD